MAEAEPFKYWAFISYSHADEAWARWLHRSLEAYRIPERLIGRQTGHGLVPKKLFPVFRDRDELAGSSELGPDLERALEQSRFLIVIASPRAAQSRWVNEEIRYFKSLGRTSRVLAFIVEGEPGAALKDHPLQECFPPALRVHVDEHGRLTDQPVEPVGADARGWADGKQNAKLKIIAGVLGLPFDDLKQRELQARSRRLAIATTLATGVATVTIVLAALAYQARNDALRRQEQSEDLLQFMLVDLRAKLEPIGKLDILDAVGQKAMEHFATLDEKDLTDKTLSSRAIALRQIGDVRVRRGDPDGAAEAFREALKLNTELVTRNPNDYVSLRNVGLSQYSMGLTHYVKGEIGEAQPWWERYLETAERLAALDPENQEWRVELVHAHINMGALAYARRDLDAAKSAFIAAHARQRELVDAEPEDQKLLDTLARIHGWLSVTEGERRRWNDALSQATLRADLLRRLIALAPDNARYLHALAQANITSLKYEARVRPLQPDTPALKELLDLGVELSERDPENIEYLRMHVLARHWLVEAHLSANNLNKAALVVGQALRLAQSAFDRAPTNAIVIDDMLSILWQSAKVAWIRGDRRITTARLEEALNLPLTEEQRKSVSASRWLELHLLGWWITQHAKSGKEHQLQTAQWMKEAGAGGSAVQPEIMLRYEALRGNPSEARRWFAELSSGERQDPYLRRFCQDFDVCGDSVVARKEKSHSNGLR